MIDNEPQNITSDRQYANQKMKRLAELEYIKERDESLRQHMIFEEGNVPWIYLDHLGNPTFGIGSLYSVHKNVLIDAGYREEDLRENINYLLANKEKFAKEGANSIPIEKRFMIKPEYVDEAYYQGIEPATKDAYEFVDFLDEYDEYGFDFRNHIISLNYQIDNVIGKFIKTRKKLYEAHENPFDVQSWYDVADEMSRSKWHNVDTPDRAKRTMNVMRELGEMINLMDIAEEVPIEYIKE
jgi:hypothetical protein